MEGEHLMFLLCCLEDTVEKVGQVNILMIEWNIGDTYIFDSNENGMSYLNVNEISRNVMPITEIQSFNRIEFCVCVNICYTRVIKFQLCLN